MHHPVVTVDLVRSDPRVKALVRKADETAALIGLTEHGERHLNLVAQNAQAILRDLGHSRREAELAAIAGYLHDTGNALNRAMHAQTGGVLAMNILANIGMPEDEILEVAGAIGHHHESDGASISRVAAALILADKADVHRSRVRNPDMIRFDIHDRVNYSVKESSIRVDKEKKEITLTLTIDLSVSGVMEYFEIFLSRMLASTKAAQFLETSFGFIVNGTRLF